MKISILEAPVCVGSPTEGSEYAYSELVSYGLRTILGEDTCFVPMDLPTPGRKGSLLLPNMKELDQVMYVSRKLFENVKSELDRKRFPIVIGGDHSCAIGSIAGVSAFTGADKLSVVYIDGHTDINTERSSLTGYIHGMPLAAAMGICSDALTVGKKINLYGKNTFIIGARSIDPAEYEIMREQGVNFYSIDDIKERGIDAIMAEVTAGINTPSIHISFDVDFVDGKEFTSTGYTMPNGASFSDARRAVRAALATGKVRSIDIVEYNPIIDSDGSDREKLFCMFEDIRDMVKSNY